MIRSALFVWLGRREGRNLKSDLLSTLGDSLLPLSPLKHYTSVILSFFIIEPGKFWLVCLSSEESKAEKNL